MEAKDGPTLRGLAANEQLSGGGDASNAFSRAPSSAELPSVGDAPLRRNDLALESDLIDNVRWRKAEGDLEFESDAFESDGAMAEAGEMKGAADRVGLTLLPELAFSSIFVLAVNEKLFQDS